MGDAKTCLYCGGQVKEVRATKTFCTPTHRKSFFKRKKRQARRLLESARRAARCLTFDGRTSGPLRQGYGTRYQPSPSAMGKPYKRDAAFEEFELFERKRWASLESLLLAALGVNA